MCTGEQINVSSCNNRFTLVAGRYTGWRANIRSGRTSLTDEEILDFAARFMGAIEAGDVAAMRACYAPNARIWHNFDNVEQTLDENVKVLEWFSRILPDRHYRIVRREALKDGFLQQHVLEATLPDGVKWNMSACVVVRMENGLISRLDEYLDSAATKALSSRNRPLPS